MGSTTFTDYVAGTNLKLCYDQAVEQATHEHGFDDYNGTISTTSGAVLYQHHPVTLERAYEIASSDAVEQYHKWDACGAIPVCESTNVDTREVECEITLLGPGHLYSRKEEIDRLIRQAGKVKPTESVIEWEIKRENMYTPNPGTITRKVTVKATEGKTETRYFVTGPDIFGNADRPDWDRGHKTQAAARASLTKWLNDGHGRPRPAPSEPFVDYEIVGITRRVSGAPLVTGYAELVKTVYPIKATVGRVVLGTDIIGYCFFGWAAR